MEHEWIEDGHRLVVRLERDAVFIDRVICPFEGSGAFCNRRRNHCVVQRFIGVFGAECNIGTSDVSGPMEIAWIGVPGDSDIDEEFATIWITPINDIDYSSYKIAQDLEE